MNVDEHILEEIANIFEAKQETETRAEDLQEDLARKCIEAHNKGISDRRISDYIGRELTRSRIQQLRARYSDV